jgi:hypothetical protein
LPKFAGEDPQEPVDVRAEGAVRRLLDPEVLERRDAVGARDPPRCGPDQTLVDPAVTAVTRDVDVGKRLEHRLIPARARSQELAIDEVLLHEHGDHRSQTPGVGPGPNAQVKVGELGGVGQHRVDHDHRPPGVLGDLLQDHARTREALGHPWVLADEHRNLGALELAAGVRAVHPVLDPRLPRLLLRQRAGPVARPQRPKERAAVAAAQVVPLAAAAVVQDRLAAVGVSNLGAALRDPPDRGLPVNLLKAPIWTSSERRRQPVAAVLIVVKPHRLVARIALGTGVLLVAPDSSEPAPVELDLDPAVALAQDAGGLCPRSLTDTHCDPFNG